MTGLAPEVPDGMIDVVQKLLNRAARRLAVDLGWGRRHFLAHRGCVRILTYHGIVPDEFADRPWVPSHYVSQSQFERQMATLAELGPAPSLGRALRDADADPQAPPAVCITFDDGMADNATLALPILQQYGHKATFFLSTGFIDSPQLLLNDVIRLLRGLNGSLTAARLEETTRRVLAENGYAKTLSVQKYAPELLAVWSQHRNEVDPAGVDCLRMMSWEQARALLDAGMEIGAHTVNHVILSHEKRRTRRDEILGSVARIRAHLNVDSVPFAFPNGLPGDYESFDLDILSAIGVPYAVTQQPGWNDTATPRLELRRNCIGRDCGDRAFLAQVYGLDDWLQMRRSA